MWWKHKQQTACRPCVTVTDRRIRGGNHPPSVSDLSPSKRDNSAQITPLKSASFFTFLLALHSSTRPVPCVCCFSVPLPSNLPLSVLEPFTLICTLFHVFSACQSRSSNCIQEDKQCVDVTIHATTDISLSPAPLALSAQLDAAFHI